MRISTQLMYQQTMGNVMDSQSSWLRAGESLSTGKKINTPSDDPIAASQSVVISQAQSQSRQYALARNFATQRESLEDSILQQVVTTVQSAMEKVVYAGNGTLSDPDRQSLAADLQGIRDQLLNLANSTDGNGRYIFAGYKTDKPPFVVDKDKPDEGRIVYQGGDEAVKQNVDAGREMVVGHTGERIFMTLPGIVVSEPIDEITGAPGVSEANVFNTFDEVIASLKEPVINSADPNAARVALVAAVDKANRGLNNSLNNILVVHAQVGVQLKELENLDLLGSERNLSLNLQKSKLEDVDWNEAISSYKLKMYALNAAYQTFTDMKGLSLFSLNR